MLILQIGKGINFGMTNPTRGPGILFLWISIVYNWISPSDTHVQIILRDSTGEEIVTKQTITRYAQHHPIYAERYLFNIHENSLDQITLVIAVVRKRSTNQTDSNFGSIAFGRFPIGGILLNIISICFFLFRSSWQWSCSDVSLGCDVEWTRWNYHTLAFLIRKIRFIYLLW